MRKNAGIPFGYTKRRTSSLRSALPTIFFVLALLILMCAALFRARTSIILRATVTQVAFSVSDSQIARLFNSVSVSSLHIAGYERLEFGPGTLTLMKRGKGYSMFLPARKTIRPADSHAPLTIKDITLQTIQFPLDSHMILSWQAEEPSTFKVESDRSVAGNFTARGAVTISCDYCTLEPDSVAESQTFTLTPTNTLGQELTFKGLAGGTILGITTSDNTRLETEGMSLTDAPIFERTVNHRRLPSFISGTIEYADLKKKPVQLASDTFVRLGECSAMHVPALAVDGKGIHIELVGRVGKLDTGVSGRVVSQLPSCLEVWWANEQLSLCGTVAGALIAAFIKGRDFLKIWKGSV